MTQTENTTANSGVNLVDFCSTDGQSRLGKPFSLGSFTYATDGHIAIRFTRDDAFPEIQRPPNIERALGEAFASVVEMRALKNPLPPAPPDNTDECDECHGTGLEHEFPTCTCDCTECEGAGSITSPVLESVTIGNGNFSAAYVRKMLTLPGLVVDADYGCKIGALAFRFDGGDGALMPIKGKYPIHLDVEL